MKKTLISNAIAAAVLAAAPVANAGTDTFNWSGYFTMLDSGGAALANTSVSAKGANQFQTPVTGTLTFDSVTGAGTGTLVPFDFFSGSAPAEAVGINMQAIGDGMGGKGTLVLGNMLFNWNGTNGIPTSIVLDAAGFFAGEMASGGANSAAPASDGTYTGATFGYLGLGPVPIATTEWDITLGNGCVLGDCMNNGASGVMPLVADVTPNGNEYAQGDGFGIGGIPMADGPFAGNNANFDITSMTWASSDAAGSIGPFCEFGVCGTPEVPVPAAVWLFGSGLLGLVGVARRKKS